MMLGVFFDTTRTVELFCDQKSDEEPSGNRGISMFSDGSHSTIPRVDARLRGPLIFAGVKNLDYSQGPASSPILSSKRAIIKVQNNSNNLVRYRFCVLLL